MKFGLSVAVFAACISGAALAAPVAPTALTNGVASQQTVNVEDNDGLLNDANWFIFFANSGDGVDIDINRLEAAPDLAAELYFGDVTGVDFGVLRAAARNRNGSPPLTFLAFEDDTEEDAFNGPHGDPRFTFSADQTGVFSVFVTSLGSEGVGGQFEVIGTGIQSVPATVPVPAAGYLLFAALAGMAAFRRRGKVG